MDILIINGPNLNLLGERDPKQYGSDSLEEVNNFIADQRREDDVEFFQSNHEGAIIDKIQQAKQKFEGIVINPGAFGHYSYAIRDAIEACSIPVIEVHLSNIYARENFRRTSITASVCSGIVSGIGKHVYILGIDALKIKS